MGGEDYRRYPFGFELGMQAWAPMVVVSNPHGADDAWLTDYCATPHPGFDLECFVPDPPTTKGEGQELRRLAEQYGWRTVIVVAFRPHISRARFILEQCFTGDLVMVASPADISAPTWAFQFVAARIQAAHSLPPRSPADPPIPTIGGRDAGPNCLAPMCDAAFLSTYVREASNRTPIFALDRTTNKEVQSVAWAGPGALGARVWWPG